MEMDRKSPLSRSEVWQTWQNFSISPFLRFNPYPRLSMRWREERQLVARIKNEREGGEGGGIGSLFKKRERLVPSFVRPSFFNRGNSFRGWTIFMADPER